MKKNNIQIGEYTIPDGYEAEIKEGKVIVKMIESEDERKRKELISFLDMHLGTSNKPSCTPKQIRDWIAYLEKQGEQSIEEIEDLSVRKYMKLDKFALANMLAERDKNNAETIKAFEKLEKQGKIPKFKSGDTIEFNGFGHNKYTIKDVCGTSHYINTNGGRMDMAYTDANFELVEQKPTNNQFTPEQVSVLNKHIDKFLEQKSAWSEEDEDMIIDLSIIIHTYFSKISGIPFKHDLSENKIKTWLKSIKERYCHQKQWKPSEEQIATAARNWIYNHEDGETLYVKDAFMAGAKWILEQLKAL